MSDKATRLKQLRSTEATHREYARLNLESADEIASKIAELEAVPDPLTFTYKGKVHRDKIHVSGSTVQHGDGNIKTAASIADMVRGYSTLYKLLMKGDN